MYINKKSAVKIFYYLMAIDDVISEDELAQLNSLGDELDGDAFQTYREQLILECETAVKEADGTELYDILSEYVDKAVSVEVGSMDEGIPSRLLVWNMLVMALTNERYDETEKRLIHHVARLCNIESSVVMEMESHIHTVSAIDKELVGYQNSSLPYSEIRPVVEELEARKKTITQSVTELISDELYESVEKIEVREDFIDKSKAFVAEKTAPVVNKVSAGAEKAWHGIKDKSAPVVEDTKKAFGKAWGNIKSRLGSNQPSSDHPDTEKGDDQ